ncbi:MAG TPA: 30S ribosomal protein S8 [Thermodesulfobacteriaceae bacterium]|nr:30S ribosomal protein S8 [Thermodesulfobacteriaceae bacterium]
MSMTDPIADMLTRIRNGSKARHKRVDMPLSNLKLDIARRLLDNGYINNFRLIRDSKQGILRIYLRYHEGRPVILGMKRISKPGRRVYAGKGKIPRIRGGLGMAIVSTSKGVMSDTQARDEGVGGEVLCVVW